MLDEHRARREVVWCRCGENDELAGMEKNDDDEGGSRTSHRMQLRKRKW